MIDRVFFLLYKLFVAIIFSNLKNEALFESILCLLVLNKNGKK